MLLNVKQKCYVILLVLGCVLKIKWRVLGLNRKAIRGALRRQRGILFPLFIAC